MKTYSVAELRIKTREIFNEAAAEPVQITRYDETFVLVKQTDMPKGAELHHAAKPKDIKVPADVAENLDPGLDLCKHGAAPGLCKVAKCPNSKRA